MPKPGQRRQQCTFNHCYADASDRYGLPLCDTCAETIAERVDHINQTQREPSGPQQEKIWHLEEQVRQLTLTIEALRRPLPAPAPEPPKQGTIYYLQVGPHIKLGWTANLHARMRKFPPNSKLLATHPGTRKDELKLHKRFAVWRSHGREWYPLVPVLLDHINRVVRDHGEPQTVSFGAQPVQVPQPKANRATYPRGWRGHKKPA